MERRSGSISVYDAGGGFLPNNGPTLLGSPLTNLEAVTKLTITYADTSLTVDDYLAISDLEIIDYPLFDPIQDIIDKGTIRGTYDLVLQIDPVVHSSNRLLFDFTTLNT